MQKYYFNYEDKENNFSSLENNKQNYLSQQSQYEKKNLSNILVDKTNTYKNVQKKEYVSEQNYLKESLYNYRQIEIKKPPINKENIQGKQNQFQESSFDHSIFSQLQKTNELTDISPSLKEMKILQQNFSQEKSFQEDPEKEKDFPYVLTDQSTLCFQSNSDLKNKTNYIKQILEEQLNQKNIQQNIQEQKVQKNQFHIQNDRSIYENKSEQQNKDLNFNKKVILQKQQCQLIEDQNNYYLPQTNKPIQKQTNHQQSIHTRHSSICEEGEIGVQGDNSLDVSKIHQGIECFQNPLQAEINQNNKVQVNSNQNKVNNSYQFQQRAPMCQNNQIIQQQQKQYQEYPLFDDEDFSRNPQIYEESSFILVKNEDFFKFQLKQEAYENMIVQQQQKIQQLEKMLKQRNNQSSQQNLHKIENKGNRSTSYQVNCQNHSFQNQNQPYIQQNCNFNENNKNPSYSQNSTCSNSFVVPQQSEYNSNRYNSSYEYFSHESKEENSNYNSNNSSQIQTNDKTTQRSQYKSIEKKKNSNQNLNSNRNSKFVNLQDQFAHLKKSMATKNSNYHESNSFINQNNKNNDHKNQDEMQANHSQEKCTIF